MYRNTLVHRRRPTKLAYIAKALGSFAISFLIGGFLLRLFSYASASETVLLFAAAAVVGIIAIVIATFALFRIWFKGFEGLPKTLLAFLYGVIALAPIAAGVVGSLLTPLSSDVFTLSAQAPELSLSRDSLAERAGFLGANLGEPRVVQNLFPVQTALPLPQVVDVVRRLAREEGWRYVRATGSMEAPPYRLNYVDETFLLGFRDDVVVELRLGRNGGTEVHMRSASRIGQSDFGTNEARIRAFLEKLALALSADGAASGPRVFQVR